MDDPRIQRLCRAISEAERFVDCAEKAIQAIQQDSWSRKAPAAAKRASMDLSNALVEVRKTSS